MPNIIIAPSKYVQGSGEMAKIAKYVERLGKKPMVLSSSSGFRRFKAVLEGSFGEQPVVFEEFCGECCMNEINRLIAELGDCDVVIGVGGGKIHDTAKAVAYYTKKPVVIVPTIASTDAPCSALSVIYTDDGVFEKYLFLPANPNLVLVDTDVIAAAPARFLVSGMGDALATYFEARACKASDSLTCAGGKITNAAFALARLCYDTLIENGYRAKLAVERGVCTKAVENIVEANTLLSGVGFESGGLAAAHAIHNGFTVLPATHEYYHGEKVAFGTLTQLVLEDSPTEEIEEVLDFCCEIGLPTCLEDIGVKEPSYDDIHAVAEAACAPSDTIHVMPFEVTTEKVCAAILGADALGRRAKGK